MYLYLAKIQDGACDMCTIALAEQRGWSVKEVLRLEQPRAYSQEGKKVAGLLSVY